MISAHLSFVLDGRDAVPKEFVVVEAAANSRLLKRDLKRFDQTSPGRAREWSKGHDVRYKRR